VFDDLVHDSQPPNHDHTCPLGSGRQGTIAGLPSNHRIARYLSFGTRRHLHPLPAVALSRMTRNAWLRGWCMPILRAEMTRAMSNRSLTSPSRLIDSRRATSKRSLILCPVFIWTKFPCLLSQPPPLPLCLLLRSWLKLGGTPVAESRSLTSKCSNPFPSLSLDIFHSVNIHLLLLFVCGSFLLPIRTARLPHTDVNLHHWHT